MKSMMHHDALRRFCAEVRKLHTGDSRLLLSLGWVEAVPGGLCITASGSAVADRYELWGE